MASPPFTSLSQTTGHHRTKPARGTNTRPRPPSPDPPPFILETCAATGAIPLIPSLLSGSRERAIPPAPSAPSEASQSADQTSPGPYRQAHSAVEATFAVH